MIARATDERTTIATIMPERPCGHTLSIFEDISGRNVLLLLAILNSFAYDFLSRQKVAGISFSHWIYKQLPLPTLEQMHQLNFQITGKPNTDFVEQRVLELVYTSWDLEQYSKDIGHSEPPFIWDSDRRSIIQAEIDSFVFHLFKNQRRDIDYIMDTFPIVKRNDINKYGEYRTKDLVLAAWDQMQEAIDNNTEYVPMTDPPPAHPSVAHPPKGT